MKASSKPPSQTTSPSKSKLLFTKGMCPQKLCSGSTVSKSQLETFRGTFKAVSDLDVLASHKDWSLAEIRALQGALPPTFPSPSK